MIRTDKIKCWTLTFQNSISTCIMDDSNKSKIFTFGKLENPEDSDSEESLSDSTDEESVSKYRGKDISSKTNENHQDLVKETERLNFKDFRHEVPIKSSDASSTASYDFCTRRNYDGSDTFAAQPRPRYGNFPERRNLLGLGQRLRGNWTLRCDDQETNLDDLTESEITWAAVNELHEKEAGVFTLRPYKCSSREGYTNINIYTPDYRDEEFILKVANILREHVYFPYVMYYYPSARYSSSIYMHTPNGEFYKKAENNCWLLIENE
ncbi:hypothetical protein AVEN_183045-2 [Araneus ventricosus]|uniref:Uncharacterized protein n=1 Tax=Araneus ventricosus TaxID=182803 RepID=A0A4Y2EX37_ARAVE|nr:hypothetical protein AVEN_183045-2 [Araneus ventricosus]